MAADTVVFVAGTATEVGKTWAAARLASALRGRGRTVRAYKPVQSYDPDEDGPTDAEVLAAATGQSSDEVCPPERSYPVPLAPPMAAARLDRPCPGLDELVQACRFADGADVGIVEGVGGLYSPLAADGCNLDLIERLDPTTVLVVAEAGLGAIHSVLACVLPLAGRRTLVFLNRFDPADEVQQLNLQWLRDGGWTVDTRVEDLADRL